MSDGNVNTKVGHQQLGNFVSVASRVPHRECRENFSRLAVGLKCNVEVMVLYYDGGMESCRSGHEFLADLDLHDKLLDSLTGVQCYYGFKSSIGGFRLNTLAYGMLQA